MIFLSLIGLNLGSPVKRSSGVDLVGLTLKRVSVLSLGDPQTRSVPFGSDVGILPTSYICKLNIKLPNF